VRFGDDPGAESNLVRLQIRADTVFVSQGDTVLATTRDGFIEGGEEQGLFVHETRMLSRYRCFMGNRRPYVAAQSNVSQDRWLGYYIIPAPGQGGDGNGSLQDAAQQTVELKIGRRVGQGLREDLDVCNHTQEPVALRLAFEVDGDFADLEETKGERKQQGKLRRRWRRDGAAHELELDYRARHAFDEQGDRGEASIHRSLVLRIECAEGEPGHRGKRFWFDLELPPRGHWHACFSWRANIDGRELRPAPCDVSVHAPEAEPPEALYLEEATRVSTAETHTLAPVVTEALAQARRDLAALRLHRLDQDERAWTVAAGVPMFMALFGRDSLTAASQSAMLGPELLRGTLPQLVRTQGTRDDAWRDESPGRILHEAHTGPLATLCHQPKGRDYFSLSSSGLFPHAVAQLWLWTGDREAVAPFIEPALRALHWIDTRTTADHRGFHASTTRSKQGIRNQSWKDSDDALVDEDGRPVSQPAATCEEQGLVFAAKRAFAEVLWAFDRRDDARRLHEEALELKRRFNEAYWMPERGYFAMALDPAQRQVRSIASNALHCLATGIADDALAPPTLERLFAPDLFTGWGVRTLSSEHPAYNPYAYHRGTVWPVEHGPLAVGAYRYGGHARLEQLCRAHFEATEIFEFQRMPECFAGHPRDEQHPFPALYPAANTPQAWSASTLVMLLQSLLGLQPYAPSGVLLVDPHLPEWLPEISLLNLRVGGAVLDLRFSRDPNDGRSRHEVLRLEGDLQVRAQPSPWSLVGCYGDALRERLDAAR